MRLLVFRVPHIVGKIISRNILNFDSLVESAGFLFARGEWRVIGIGVMGYFSFFEFNLFQLNNFPANKSRAICTVDEHGLFVRLSARTVIAIGISVLFLLRLAIKVV